MTTHRSDEEFVVFIGRNLQQGIMLKIKKGDTVAIIAGKDKGVESRVLAMVGEDKILVEKVNVVTKHIKPTQGGKKGERITVEAPIHISNAMLIDPSTKKKTRVGFSFDDKGNKMRVAKTSGKEIVSNKG